MTGVMAEILLRWAATRLSGENVGRHLGLVPSDRIGAPKPRGRTGARAPSGGHQRTARCFSRPLRRFPVARDLPLTTGSDGFSLSPILNQICRRADAFVARSHIVPSSKLSAALTGVASAVSIKGPGRKEHT